MWCNKYKPQKLSDLIISPKDRQAITSWLKSMKKHCATTNCLFLHGSPGTGKTTLAYIILKEFNFDIIELNSSDHRTQKNIKLKINDILGKKNVVSMFDKKNKDIAIIMDEIDGLTSGERGSLTELIKILFPKKNEIKKNSEKYLYIKQNPFICISNTVDKKILSIKKKSLFIEVKKPSINDLLKLSYKILDAEKISYDEDTVKKIVQNTQRDIRQLIIQLEYYFTNKNNEALCLQKMKKEIEYTHFESAEKILRKYHKIANTRQITDSNFNIVSMIFFENFLNDILKNRKGKKEEKIRVIEYIYNSFVNGDIMDKEIFVKQNWILHDYASVDKCSRPSFLLNNLDSYTPLKDNRLNYSSLLNKSSLEFFNIKSKHQISEKYTNNSQSIDLHEIAEIDEELAKKFI